jgi:TRAP-type mannitol/chloroaromatic compound transport system permease small subunit
MIEHKPTGPVDRVTFAFSRVMIWGSLLLVGIMSYEVIMRYIFFKPTLWVNEMSLWVGGIIYITSGLYAMQQRSHIRIYVLYEMAPKWMRQLFDILSVLCTSIFVLAVLWGGLGEAIAKFGRWEAFGTAWDPPIPATDKPVLLGALFFLFLQAISNLIRDWPAAAWVRKVFDVMAGLVIIVLCLWAIPLLFPSGNPDFAVPMIWRIVIALMLLAFVAYSVLGLLRDFNLTPTPYVESHDPTEEFDLPEDIMAKRQQQAAETAAASGTTAQRG